MTDENPTSLGRGPAVTPEDAIRSRRSIRAFRPDPVDPQLIRRLLETASRAPSGTNTQPWRVYVVTGAARDGLCDEIVDAFLNDAPHEEEYPYSPERWGEPYQSRRRANGWGLYGLLGIERGDKARMKAQHARNFKLFDAPVGLFFTIDRDLQYGSWLDNGLFLQTIMVAAREFGLDTCPQQAFARYHEIIQRRLEIPAQEMVICGMAMGYADMSAPENALVTEREPVDGFATFID